MLLRDFTVYVESGDVSFHLNMFTVDYWHDESTKAGMQEFRANMVRVDSDFRAPPFKAKISNSER